MSNAITMNALTTTRPMRVFLDNRRWPYQVTLQSPSHKANQPANGSQRLLYCVTAALEAAHECLQVHQYQAAPDGTGYEIDRNGGQVSVVIDPRIITPDRLRAVWPVLVAAMNDALTQSQILFKEAA
ncbi:hypothetical protein EV679_0335 [Kerstersia gyiorum]|uniref:Uncharacterized protein n=1 Tax=Kerstersia gyiorum TaxID=206506 RepID=A0A4V2F1B9_9BURK|nr:hypothetical protein [Kerstersia gyiorum]KAB0544165.1 hypothetical protein F7P85_05995 [Kerstersia gyiorum]RZS73147.1 hypothetical protein EV679_0335 [Kerstersia gyiorum]